MYLTLYMLLNIDLFKNEMDIFTPPFLMMKSSNIFRYDQLFPFYTLALQVHLVVVCSWVHVKCWDIIFDKRTIEGSRISND